MAVLSGSSSSSSNPHHMGSLPLWLLSAIKVARIEGKTSSELIKQVRHSLASFLRQRLAALKSKTRAIKIQLIIFSLLHSKKVLMRAVSDKIHALISHPDKREAGATAADGGSKMIGRHRAPRSKAASTPETPKSCTPMSSTSGRLDATLEEEDYEDKMFCYQNYGLISRSLSFDDEVGRDYTESVMDDEEENQGKTVLVDDDINKVAELFIKRIRRQMMLERLNSFSMIQQDGT